MCLKTGPERDKNKKAFLESLGFSFIEFEKYSDIYDNTVWKNFPVKYARTMAEKLSRKIFRY